MVVADTADVAADTVVVVDAAATTIATAVRYVFMLSACRRVGSIIIIVLVEVTHKALCAGVNKRSCTVFHRARLLSKCALR